MELEQWKQKYYDQLDRLEKKEQDWELLESTLKRTIGRLSLAAEGQNSTLDRHIGDLRSAIKNDINQQRLDSIVDDISRILTKLEENQSQPNRASVNTLEQLIKQLTLPKNLDKKRNKLLKKFQKSDDDQSDALIKETLLLLKSATSTEQQTSEKTSLLDRIFTSDKSSSDDQDIDIENITVILHHILSLVPWPATIKNDSVSTIAAIKKCDSENDLNKQLKQLENIIGQWPTIENTAKVIDTSSDSTQLETYKHCLIQLLNKLDSADSPNGKLTAFKISARDAKQIDDLENLSDQLSEMLSQHTETTDKIVEISQSLDSAISDSSLQPSIQELLIRLLEQLIVPVDLQSEADSMKHRLEQETDQTNWKILLKDVASLINSIRSRMQKEKHEFEHFLQQVTDRLKTMDQFLQLETSNLKDAETQGNNFDQKINLNVSEIRKDLNQATELSNLKQTVNSKLDTIADHIKLYRQSEQDRVQQSQQQVEAMHSKMQALEKEAESLKLVVIEKNKQAMFDTLTEIPNRLSYEKKVEEEIARWKRFKNPLSMAIWDIDFFKKVNDNYGHKAGDKVLKTVAQLLNKRIRATDFLARYGGEEFVMLLPGTVQEETLRLVNDLRQQIEECGFHYHGKSVPITVSCGVSCFTEGDTLGQVFERADQALYKAKENGRNQCVVAACLSTE